MSDTGSVCLSTLVEAVIEPVLPAPFGLQQAVQPGDLANDPLDPAAIDPWPTEPASLLWCAGPAEMWAAYPALERAQRGFLDDYRGGAERACFDILIDLDEDGRLLRVDLEFTTLAESLLAFGDDSRATRARTLIGQPGKDATYAVAELLGHVFNTRE